MSISYSPIPEVIQVLKNVSSHDSDVKLKCARQVGLLSTAGVDF
jgi:hypothetical protein